LCSQTPTPHHLTFSFEQKKKHEDIAQELETKLLRGKLKQMELEEGSVETSYPPIIQSGAAKIRLTVSIYYFLSTCLRFSIQPTSVPCFPIWLPPLPRLHVGGRYNLKPSAMSDAHNLRPDVIVCSIGARYLSFCSNVSRTYIIEPSKVNWWECPW
jgi:nucleosome binding factor SPN SPT16 subunit